MVHVGAEAPGRDAVLGQLGSECIDSLLTARDQRNAEALGTEPACDRRTETGAGSYDRHRRHDRPPRHRCLGVAPQAQLCEPVALAFDPCGSQWWVRA